MKELVAIGRISNPFMYDSLIMECDAVDAIREMIELEEYLNRCGQAGWKLHTIERIRAGRYFCVWEKLDYGEKKA